MPCPSGRTDLSVHCFARGTSVLAVCQSCKAQCSLEAAQAIHIYIYTMDLTAELIICSFSSILQAGRMLLWSVMCIGRSVYAQPKHVTEHMITLLCPLSVSIQVFYFNDEVSLLMMCNWSACIKASEILHLILLAGTHQSDGHIPLGSDAFGRIMTPTYAASDHEVFISQ